jgi:hypothetical protein
MRFLLKIPLHWSEIGLWTWVSFQLLVARLWLRGYYALFDMFTIHSSKSKMRDEMEVPSSPRSSVLPMVWLSANGKTFL